MNLPLFDSFNENDRLVIRCNICKAERSFKSDPTFPGSCRAAEGEAQAWWLEHKGACHPLASEDRWTKEVPDCHRCTQPWWVPVTCTCTCPSCDGPCAMLRDSRIARMHIILAVREEGSLDMQGLRGALAGRKVNIRELQLRELVIEIIKDGWLVLVDAGCNRTEPELEPAMGVGKQKVWNTRGIIAAPELANAS